MTEADPVSSTFADAERRLSDSPVLGALCRAVAADPDLVRPAWPDGATPGWSLALRLFTAVHHTLLEHAPDHPLAAWYPTLGGSRAPDNDLPSAFADLLASHTADLAGWADRPPRGADPQCCAQLRPALAWAAGQSDAAHLALVELGGAAGLGLFADRYGYAYDLPDGRAVRTGDGPVTLGCQVTGAPAELLTAPLPVAGRTELELDRIDLTDDEALSWLLAVAPPEDVAQHQRVRAAVELARGLPVDWCDGDLLASLPAVLADVPEDVLPVVHGVSVLCSMNEPGKVLDVLTASGRDLVWLLAEVPGVALPLVTTDTPDVTPSDRAVTAVVLRGGAVEQVTLLATGGQDATDLRWAPRDLTPLPESTPVLP